ncbi:MAG: hypothetical protein ACREJN_03035 [Nitrospiraceae bacterium]
MEHSNGESQSTRHDCTVLCLETIRSGNNVSSWVDEEAVSWFLGLTGCHTSRRLIGYEGEAMIKGTDSVGLLFGSFLITFGCSTASTPATNPDTVRQHADKQFQQLKAEEHPPESGDSQAASQGSIAGDTPSQPAPSPKKGVQIPPAEVGASDGEFVRATGYGDLAKGLYLCQHSADLAARVELSKLARVQVTEKSVDRIRERTGKDAEQDIEVVREGLVNEVLSGVRIVNRNVDKEVGTCSSIAVIPKRNLFPTSSNPDARSSAPQ